MKGWTARVANGNHNEEHTMIRRLLTAPFRMVNRLFGGMRRTRTTRRTTMPRTTTMHRTTY